MCLTPRFIIRKIIFMILGGSFVALLILQTLQLNTRFKQFEETDIFQRPTIRDRILDRINDIERKQNQIRDVSIHNVQTPERPYDHVQPHIYYGPGEQGKGVKINITLLSAEDKIRYEEGMKKHHMNEYVSDLISFHRTLNPDLIDPSCANITYDDDLDPCTIIIAFRNEAWSTLIRTLHSILDRTPHDLIEEILLVDDGSTDDHLKYRLDFYISFLPKTRIIRIPTSLGAMSAYQTAVDVVKSKYFAIFDSHCEVAEGWLPPLLQRLKDNYKLFVTPAVGEIFYNTFYNSRPDVYSLSMSLDFYLYQRYSPYKKEYIESLQRNEPIRIAGHQANAFVVNTAFFMQLGGFDTGMKVWGEDMMELMFKYVMCGGDMELIPCSHVGHMYRKSVIWGKELGQEEISNAYRVAEVWMDDYRHMVFERLGNYTMKTGDVSSRRQIRNENNCKPFKYFLDHIREIIHLYVPENLRASGAIIKPGHKLCLHFDRSKSILAECHWRGYQQFWEWSADKEVRQGVNCLVPVGENDVRIVDCDFQNIVQWEYHIDNVLECLEVGLCLTASNDNSVNLQKCTGSNNQIWLWDRKT